MTRTSLKSLLNSLLSILNRYQVFFLLGLGLVVGLLFVFLVPPWMNYDEPGHLEYAWLIANQPGLPERGDYDQQFRRQVSASAIKHDIEGFTYMVSDPMVIDQPINIWITHIGNHPPTYYLLAGLPLRLFRHTDIDFQLYVVRIVSLALFLAIIWVAHRASRDLFGYGHPLTWMVPLFLVTLPAFVDVMSAANNDVAAVLAFSLFTWAAVILIQRGITLPRLMTLLASVVLCLLTKNTAWLAAPLSLFVLPLAFFKDKRSEKIFWPVLGILTLILVSLAFSFQNGSPAFFYSNTADALPLRLQANQTPVGNTVIAQNAQKHPWQGFYHLLSPHDLARLSGQTATMGAWIWADQPTDIHFPRIREGRIVLPTMLSAPVPSEFRLSIFRTQQPTIATPTEIRFTNQRIQLQTTPQFYAFTVDMPPMAENITWVFFPPTTDEGVQVYWDGIILVPGSFSADFLPIFDNPDAGSGTWQGQPIKNLIRNASGQQAWPVFSDWLRSIIPSRINPQVSGFLSVFDFQATALYFRLAGSRVFRTFWAVFGWGNVPLYGQKPYHFFVILTLMYLAGMIFVWFRKRTLLTWHLSSFLVLAVVSQVIIVIFRGVNTWFSTVYFPVGRYLYPVILPLGMLFMLGADNLIDNANRVLKIPKNVLYGGLIAFHILVILWGVFSIWLFYHRL